MANPADVASIDAIIGAAYDSISGPAGQKRDWDRERTLYYPGARLIPTAKPGTNSGLAPQVFCRARIFRKRNCTAYRTIRTYRSRLEHV